MAGLGVQVVLMLLPLLLQLLSTPTSAAGSRLLQVQALCRHGLRTPFSRATFPTDQFDSIPWENGRNNLVPVGVRDQYQLGRFLRRVYGSHLPFSTCKGVYSISSNTSRTVESGVAVLLGLFAHTQYGNSIGVDYDGGLLPSTNPICPLDIIDVPDDHILNVILHEEDACPKLDRLVKAEVERVADLTPTFPALQQVFKANAGIENPTYRDMYLSWDSLRVQRIFGFQVPAWALQPLTGFKHLTVFDALADIFNTRNALAASPELRRLSVGGLMRTLLDNMYNMLDNNGRPLVVLNAHSTTLSGMEVVLGFSGKILPTSTCMLFELHQSQGGPVVRLLRRHGETTDIEELPLPCRRQPCPLQELERNLPWVPRSVQDVKSECKE